MPANTPISIVSELQKLAPSAIIELYVLDLTSIGGPVVNYHGGTNELLQPIVWQGVTYYPFPVSATGFEYNGKGTLPRPKLQAANVSSAITALLIQYGDFVGCKLTRKRTLVKYLDPINFILTPAKHYERAGYLEGRVINAGGVFDRAYYATTYPDVATAYAGQDVIQHFIAFGIAEGRNGNAAGPFDSGYYLGAYADIATAQNAGINPTADPTASFPDDVFYIEQRTAENRDVVEFSLAASFDFQGLQLPRRPIIQNVCLWKYRGPECGWTGGPATIDDVPTSDWSLDVCSKRLAGCRCRFGANNPIPYGGFPGASVSH
jgi:phage-related protein